jgi:uncharacterized protein (TIGR02466 family)
MQIIREDWWATPVWYFNIPEQEINPKKIAEECYLEKNKSEGRIVSNINGWQSNDIYDNPQTSNISNLIKTIKTYSKNIFQDYGIKKEINLDVFNYWVNINIPGSSNVTHTHPECALAAIYYVSAPKNSGNLILHNNSIMQFINRLYLDGDNKNTVNTIEYTPHTGKVIIFPAWLPHSVGKNNSSEDRISIAFNFSTK